MNLESQQILCNLRMIKGLDKDQWLSTKRNQNGKLEIDDILDNTYYNNACLAMKMDGWESTKECLKTLYCDDVPKLVKELMEQKEHKDLKNLNALLKESLDGLDNLGNTYDSNITANHILSLRCDYGEAIHEKINEYLLKIEN